jgi:twinkle protein
MSVAKNVVKDPLSSEAVAWLQSRGISQKTAEKAGVTSTRHWIQALGKETECIQFPYKNKGQEYAYKIRSIEDKGFSCNGSPQTFFNIESAERNDWLIICEGEMDVLAFMEGGYNSVVSVPNGAVMKVVDGHIDPKDDNKFKFLWEAKKQIDAAAKIVIATDSDAPGQAMAEEIARRIGKDRCWKIEYPEGCKDANDVLMSAGADGVDNIVVNSKPWPVAGLYDAEHFYEELTTIYDRGMGRGESTGYNNVDELYSVVTGQLTVVTGHPSSGKSEFIDQIMVNLAQSKGWKFAICSFENEPRIHIAKLISKHLRKPFFDGPSPRMTKEELGRGKEFVQSHFSFLYQADGSLSSVDSIIERLKVAVLRHGVRGAIIDPYNYIQKGRDVSETDWVSDVPDQAARLCSGTRHPPLVRGTPDEDDARPDGQGASPQGVRHLRFCCVVCQGRRGPDSTPPRSCELHRLRDPHLEVPVLMGRQAGAHRTRLRCADLDIQDTCPRSIPRYQHTSRGTPWVQRR